MKILIIGYGSIGKRHARNITSLGHDVCLLRHNKKSRNYEGFVEYYSYETVHRKRSSIDGAIICSPTSRHYHDVAQMIGNQIPFLLEKPPATSLSETLRIKDLIERAQFQAYDIAYNFRFYPLFEALRKFLPNIGQTYATQISAGYYLPYWRKNADYRKTISARDELGGGVHNELVHEIDYLVWLMGVPKCVFGYVNRVSPLEIETADICSAIMEYADGAIAELHLNYLSQNYMRELRIIAEKGTLTWHLNENRILYYNKARRDYETVCQLDTTYDFNDTYIKEIEHFMGIISGDKQPRVGINEAVQVMMILEAIKISHREGKKITLNDLMEAGR